MQNVHFFPFEINKNIPRYYWITARTFEGGTPGEHHRIAIFTFSNKADNSEIPVARSVY